MNGSASVWCTFATAHGTRLCFQPGHATLRHLADGAVAFELIDGQMWFDRERPVMYDGPGGAVSLRSLQIEAHPDGGVALGDGSGRYLCATPVETGGGAAVLCAPAALGAWERFTVEPAEMRLTPEQAFLANMAAGCAPAGNGGPRRIGVELDGLAEAQAEWSVHKACNLMLMRARPPQHRAAVVATAKNEGAYVLEWLAHARAVGFEHAFIYTNDNTDQSEPLLEALHRAGRITLIYNEVAAHVSPQVKAYEHAVHLLPELRTFEWAMFADLDELLLPAAQHGHQVGRWIDDVERRWSTERPAAICVNWDWYGSGRQAVRAEGLVQERFVYSRPHAMVKSLVRLADITTMWPIHVPDPGCVLCVDSMGARLEVTGPEVGRVEFGGGKLNHYYHKSFEEFVVKHNRGRGGAPGGLAGKPLQSFFSLGRGAAAGAGEPDAARAAAAGEARAGVVAAIARCGGGRAGDAASACGVGDADAS